MKERRDKKVALYGAGKRGKTILSFLGKERVACFVETTPVVQKVMDIPVFSLDQLANRKEEYFVVVTPKKRNVIEEIEGLLTQHDILYTKWEYIEAFLRGDEQLEMQEVEDTIRLLCNELSKKWNLRQNKSSEVEFYFVDSFEVSHFLPICLTLIEKGIKAEIVLEHPGINAVGSYFDYDSACQILDSNGVSYLTMSNVNAPIAITTQFAHCLEHYKNKKVQLCYGVSFLKGKAFELQPDVTEPFDHVLVNGTFYKKKISENRSPDTVTDIAYPRYRQHFLSPEDKETVLKRLNIETNRPILVYYPTWDEHSSIQQYAEKIGNLRDEFYVIAKPHHCTLRFSENKGDLKLLEQNADYVVDAIGSLSELSRISDVAICDAMSGSLCEVAYLNRSVHMLAIMEPGTKNRFYFDPGLLAITVERPEELERCVRELKTEDPLLISRRMLIRELISEDFDAGMERCVAAVRKELIS